MNKAQGALEYLLLIGGAVLVSVIVVAFFLGLSSDFNQDAQVTQGSALTQIEKLRDASVASQIESQTDGIVFFYATGSEIPNNSIILGADGDGDSDLDQQTIVIEFEEPSEITSIILNSNPIVVCSTIVECNLICETNNDKRFTCKIPNVLIGEHELVVNATKIGSSSGGAKSLEFNATATTNPCELIPETEGFCKRLWYLPYFNQQTETCEMFMTGGCSAITEPFETIEECQSTCETGGHEDGENLLLNSGFEDSSLVYAEWVMSMGGASSAVIKQDQKYSGSNSVWFGSDGGTVVLQQAVSVESGATYKLEGFIKTQLGSGACYIDLYKYSYLDSPGARDASTGNVAVGDSEWTYYSEEVTMPSNVSLVYVRMLEDANPNGVCWFDDISLVKVTDVELEYPGENLKNPDKYSEKEVFLISDNDWSDVLSLVPITTWTGDEQWCQRGHGTPENVCVYPTLIYHDETDEGNGFDADSILYFLEQYNTGKVIVVGETPTELQGHLISTLSEINGESQEIIEAERIESISSADYFSFWDSFDTVVYVENDYELALMASTYASLINAPLVVEGITLDSPNVFAGRNIVLVGSVSCPEGATCLPKNTFTNLVSLQQKYVEETNTDKIILVNPNDLDIKVNEVFETEKGGTVHEIYSKTSLAAPILASAKHEILISKKSTDVDEISSFIKSFLLANQSILQNSLPISVRSYEGPYLYLYDLERRIDEKLSAQFIPTWDNPYPSFYGNNIGYTKSDGGLYLYDLSNNTETKIIDIDLESEGPIMRPSIFGDKIVYDQLYSGELDGDILRSTAIYTYNLSSETKEKIKEIPSDGINQVILSGLKLCSQDKVIYVNNLNDNLYVYDILNKTETEVDSDLYYNSGFYCSDNKLAYSKSNQIYLYDLRSGTKELVGNGNLSINNSSILGNNLLYSVYNYGDNSFDLYLYNINSKQNEKIVYNIKDSSVKSNITFGITENYVIYGQNITDAYGDVQLYSYNLETKEILPVTDEYSRIWSNQIAFFGDTMVLFDQGRMTKREIRGYLTIFGSNSAIPLSRLTGMMGFGTEIYSSNDQTKYADIYNEKYNYPDLITGRVMGVDLSDVSSYIARDLFYGFLPVSNNVIILASSPEFLDEFNRYSNWADSFRFAGYNSRSELSEELSHNFEPNTWVNQQLINYNDHGSRFFSGIYPDEVPELSNSLIVSMACSTCSYESTPYQDSRVICAKAIRKGALMYVGAVSPIEGGKLSSGGYNNYTENDVSRDIINNIYYTGYNLGQAFTAAYSASGGFTLIGDPTLDIKPPNKLKERLK